MPGKDSVVKPVNQSTVIPKTNPIAMERLVAICSPYPVGSFWTPVKPVKVKPVPVREVASLKPLTPR